MICIKQIATIFKVKLVWLFASIKRHLALADIVFVLLLSMCMINMIFSNKNSMIINKNERANAMILFKQQVKMKRLVMAGILFAAIVLFHGGIFAALPFKMSYEL